MLSDNPFIDLDPVDLAATQALYIQALKDVVTAGQSYSFQGRSFTRADIKEIRVTLGQINVAIRFQSGTGSFQTVYATVQTQCPFDA
jgi:hypothetical protein